MIYLVLTKQQDDEGEMVNVIESRRTSRRAAEDDVRHLSDVAHRKAWIVEEA